MSTRVTEEVDPVDVMHGPELAAALEGAQPFERFVLDYLLARGSQIEPQAAGEYRATFDGPLAKKLRRKGAVLIFDPERASLPRGGVFVAPGSRFGLAVLETAREGSLIARAHLAARDDVNVKKLAAEGFTLHDAKAGKPKLSEPIWATQVVFHCTLTLRGGVAEQDLRSVSADPRGPVFEFLELEDRRGWALQPEFPDEPVWWDDARRAENLDRAAAQELWGQAREWITRVQESRLERWRKRCEESREKDLERVNTYYRTRLQEEEERRRRRRDDLDEEDRASEAQLKVEWGRRVRSIRERWEPAAELRLWGVEEIARPRVPVTWPLETPDGRRELRGEVDLADGALARQPCPVCGRLAGEFWWVGELVCRRCRGEGRRKRAKSAKRK